MAFLISRTRARVPRPLCHCLLPKPTLQLCRDSANSGWDRAYSCAFVLSCTHHSLRRCAEINLLNNKIKLLLIQTSYFGSDFGAFT